MTGLHGEVDELPGNTGQLLVRLHNETGFEGNGNFKGPHCKIRAAKSKGGAARGHIAETDIISKLNHMVHTEDLLVVGDGVGDDIVLFKSIDHEVVDAGELVQKAHILPLQCFNGNALQSRQRVIGVQYGADLYFGDRDDLQGGTFRLGREGVVAQIQHIRADLFDVVIHGALVQMDLRTPPAGEEGGVEMGQEPQAQCGTHAQPQCLVGSGGEIRGQLLRLPAFLQNAADPQHELFAFIGKGDLFGIPDDEGDAQLLFQGADGGGNGGLGDEALLAGAGKIPIAVHGFQIFQTFDIQHKSHDPFGKETSSKTSRFLRFVIKQAFLSKIMVSLFKEVVKATKHLLVGRKRKNFAKNGKNWMSK